MKMRNAILPCKGDSVTESVRKVVFDIAVVALVITGGSLLSDVVGRVIQQQKDDVIADDYDNFRDEEDDEVIIGQLDLTDEEKETILKEQPQILPLFMEYYNTNKDIVGWITVGEGENKIVNHPVMQAADNDYYLTHTFENKEDKGGAIFADYRNEFEAGKLSGNTVLYGHNMKTGAMFGNLRNYENLYFYQKNPFVTFDTMYEDGRYVIFSITELSLNAKDRNYFSFGKLDSDNIAWREEAISDLISHSVFYTDIDVQPEDQLLLLITCVDDEEERRVVAARRIREDETEASLQRSVNRARKW